MLYVHSEAALLALVASRPETLHGSLLDRNVVGHIQRVPKVCEASGKVDGVLP